MYVVEAGAADVTVADRHGSSHHVNRIVAGDVLGEMSLFTGRPASATVTALEDLTVTILAEAEFHALGDTLPRLYQNLGAMVSRKLYRADRRPLDTTGASLIGVQCDASEPLGGYCLASSLAWHVRAPVLLIAFGADAVLPLTPFAMPETRATQVLDAVLEGRGVAVEQRAHVLLPDGQPSFAPERLPRTLDALTDCFKYVLLQGGRFSSISICRVPLLGSLIRSDEQALHQGLLPLATGAGQSLGRIARDLASMKVGVALGAGGMRGFAHIGVLGALTSAGVPIDFLAGCSVGALVGALFALGHAPERIAELLERGGATSVRPAVSIHSLFSDAPMQRFGREVIGTGCIEDLSPNLAIVAADIETGDEVVFRSGPLWPAVLASLAIPGVLPAQRINGRVLVDGGIVDPIPVGVLADMGADVVLAVNLASERHVRRVEDVARLPSGRPPSLLEVITRSVEILQSRVAPPTSSDSIIIEPWCDSAKSLDLRHFGRGIRYVPNGKAALEQVLPHIAAVLPWVDSTTAG
jgi:NTE family protein